MKIKLNIKLNKNREPFIITEYKKSEVIKSVADIKAYYDITINIKEKIFIYSFTQYDYSDNLMLEELDYVFSDDDYSIFDELFDIIKSKDKVYEILEKLDIELIKLFDNKKENYILEIEVKDNLE